MTTLCRGGSVGLPLHNYDCALLLFVFTPGVFLSLLQLRVAAFGFVPQRERLSHCRTHFAWRIGGAGTVQVPRYRRPLDSLIEHGDPGRDTHLQLKPQPLACTDASRRQAPPAL